MRGERPRFCKPCRVVDLETLQGPLGRLAYTYALLGTHPFGRSGPHVAARWWEYVIMLAAADEATPQGGDEDGFALSVLEVGPGGFRSPLAPTLALAGHHVVCLDPRPEAVAEVEEQAAYLGLTTRLTAQVGDICDYMYCVENIARGTPVVDLLHDLVVSVSVLEHIPRDDEALRNMVAWLRPGGVLAFTFDLGVTEGATHTPRQERLYQEHDVWNRIALLEGLGVDPIGAVDYSDRVPNVYGVYTFGSFVGRKRMAS